MEILSYSTVVLFSGGVNALFAKKPGCGKSHVLFPLGINGLPQEFETVRFNSELKLYKSV